MKNIANYISTTRIIASILLIFFDTFSVPFYILYIFCGISDIFDGFLARKLKITSDKGAKIDSIADLVFVLIAMIKILPNLIIPTFIAIWISAILFIKICNIFCGFFYHKKFISLHTTANKITGLTLFLMPLFLWVIDFLTLAIIVCVSATFSAIQEGYLICTKKSQ